MSWKKLAIIVYLGVGIWLFFASGEITTLATGYTHHKLRFFEIGTQFQIERVARLQITPANDNTYHIQLDAVLAEGNKHTFQADVKIQDASLAKLRTPLPTPALLWIFDTPKGYHSGGRGYPVDNDGIPASTTHILTPAKRQIATFATLVRTQEGRLWTLALSFPEHGKRPLDAHPVKANVNSYAMLRGPEDPIRQSIKDILKVVLTPVAFVIDVLIWPLALVYFMVIFQMPHA